MVKNLLEVKVSMLVDEISDTQREIEITKEQINDSYWSDRLTRVHNNILASLNEALERKLSLLEALTR